MQPYRLTNVISNATTLIAIEVVAKSGCTYTYFSIIELPIMPLAFFILKDMHKTVTQFMLKYIMKTYS